MRSRTFRRTILAVALATGPLTAACELALDFDRSPLQPVYEGGTEEPGGPDSSTDGPREGSAARDGGGRDAPSEPAPQDSGMDAEGG